MAKLSKERLGELRAQTRGQAPNSQADLSIEDLAALLDMAKPAKAKPKAKK